MRKLSVLTFLCIGILIGCATEKVTHQTNIPREKCDAPIYKMGDTWKFQTEFQKAWSEKVVKVEEDLAFFQTAGSKYMRGRDTKTLQTKVQLDTVDGKKTSSQPEELYWDFPLYVGKKWSKTVSGPTTEAWDISYIFTFKVIAFEELTVPAGKFQAFKIEREQNVSGTGNSVITYFWYSPDVKHFIKHKFHASYGGWRVGGADYELLSYQPAP